MYKIIEYDNKYEAGLRKLWVDVCVEEYGFEEWREEIEQIENEKYNKMLLAIVDDKVVGSMGYIDKGNGIAEIKRVYIYPEYRGNGLSQTFLELIIKELEEKEYSKVLVQTWSKFNRGIGFYIKNGFVLVNTEGECYNYERLLLNENIEPVENIG